MAALPIIDAVSRRDGAVAEVIRTFRLLTGGRAARDAGRRTLVACSGGADSSALALILARTKAPLVVAHIVHDLRAPEEALADRDAVRELAGALGKDFVERAIAVRCVAGNAEGNARRLRYRALAVLAGENGCRFVAVAHHADDQAETLLMRLLRGSGPRGLGAMAETRRLAAGVELIRPMLGVTRADAERLCQSAGWSWREDATNADTTRLRAAVRVQLLPVVRRLSPGAPRRLAATAALLRDGASLLEERVQGLVAHGKVSGEGASGVIGFPRELLRRQSGAVVGELLRSVAAQVAGMRGADRWTSRPVLAAVRSIRGSSTDPRTFRWRAVEVVVTARTVTVRGASAGRAAGE